MTKALEVMTRSLATCTPETAVGEVALTMRDRDIGTVLVIKDGDLKGIVTDRDLVVRALAERDEMARAPVSRYMSEQVHTGEADWSLEKVSEYMAKHQIRRLPIMENGQVTGIVSLGDVARYGAKKQKVAETLREVSEPAPQHMLERVASPRALAGLAVAASAATAVALLMANGAIPFRRRKPRVREFYDAAQERLHSARERLGVPAARKPMRQVREVSELVGQRLGSTVEDLLAQLPARS